MNSVFFVLSICMVCSSSFAGVHAAKTNFCEVKCPFNIIPCERYMTDSQGCPTCQCLCYSFRLICPKNCSSGTEYVKDDIGCSYCRCACAKSCVQPCRHDNQLEFSPCA